MRRIEKRKQIEERALQIGNKISSALNINRVKGAEVEFKDVRDERGYIITFPKSEEYKIDDVKEDLRLMLGGEVGITDYDNQLVVTIPNDYGASDYFEKNQNTITLPENVEIQLEDRTVILEKGDRVQIVKVEEGMKMGYPRKQEFIKALHLIYKEYTTDMELDDYYMGVYFNEEIMRLIDVAQREL